MTSVLMKKPKLIAATLVRYFIIDFSLASKTELNNVMEMRDNFLASSKGRDMIFFFFFSENSKLTLQVALSSWNRFNGRSGSWFRTRVWRYSSSCISVNQSQGSSGIPSWQKWRRLRRNIPSPIRGLIWFVDGISKVPSPHHHSVFVGFRVYWSNSATKLGYIFPASCRSSKTGSIKRKFDYPRSLKY
jgi:hypothetical protein